MTLKQIQDSCWNDLPPLRKRMAGRAAVDDIVSAAISNWNSEALAAYGVERYSNELSARVGRYGEATYGFIWVFILQAVASAVIQWLIKRWLENHSSIDEACQ